MNPYQKNTHLDNATYILLSIAASIPITNSLHSYRPLLPLLVAIKAVYISWPAAFLKKTKLEPKNLCILIELILFYVVKAVGSLMYQGRRTSLYYASADVSLNRIDRLIPRIVVILELVEFDVWAVCS